MSDIDPDNPEEQYDDNYSICPYCGQKYGDCFEWVTECDEKTACSNCGREFLVRADVSISYVSTPLEDEKYV